MKQRTAGHIRPENRSYHFPAEKRENDALFPAVASIDRQARTYLHPSSLPTLLLRRTFEFAVLLEHRQHAVERQAGPGVVVSARHGVGDEDGVDYGLSQCPVRRVTRSVG